MYLLRRVPIHLKPTDAMRKRENRHRNAHREKVLSQARQRLEDGCVSKPRNASVAGSHWKKGKEQILLQSLWREPTLLTP